MRNKISKARKVYDDLVCDFDGDLHEVEEYCLDRIDEGDEFYHEVMSICVKESDDIRYGLYY